MSKKNGLREKINHILSERHESYMYKKCTNKILPHANITFQNKTGCLSLNVGSIFCRLLTE